MENGMQKLALWKGIALLAAIMITPISAIAQHQGRCDRIYEETLNNCRTAKAEQCDRARHDARRTCHSSSRHNCYSAKKLADNVCSPRGCRSRAEAEQRSCLRGRHHQRRGY